MADAPLIAWWDIESDGLWPPQPGMGVMTQCHCVYIEMSDGRIFNCADQPGYTPIHVGLRALMEADLRVSHNGQAFDERAIRKFYPWFQPKAGSKVLDTLILSRLLFPTIMKEGPNTHLCPPMLKSRHSVAAWGHRLRCAKGDYTDYAKSIGIDPWAKWCKEMQDYMVQDVAVLKRIFAYLMAQKPAPLAVDIEHGFASIIRRQEVWGFTFNLEKANQLNADVQVTKARLELELIETFGAWWQPGKDVRVKATRRVKVLGHPDVTMPRFGKNGNRLKDYVGPPLCIYEEGALYTPIERVEFKPSSRQHVHRVLVQKYGWRPSKFTDKKAVKVDDEVLRSLPYPEAPMLADYYAALKVDGYLNSGAQAWLSVMRDDGDSHRVFGQVMTIGTGSFRASHFKPNMGQIPTRDPVYGHRCRELFKARLRFILAGFDGSGMQLRLLAHYLEKGGLRSDKTKWTDGGVYTNVFRQGVDPHGFMRDTIGVDLMGEGDEGRGKGKTVNYALVFGGGDKKLGSIIEPTASDGRKVHLGGIVKDRMGGAFGTAFDDLKDQLKRSVETRGFLYGLDGRKCNIFKAHAALAFLLQMGEAVVMKLALMIFDEWLQGEGFIPGVDAAGVAHPELADYEFTANVHDEAQADIREAIKDRYTELALACVAEAGKRLGVLCPLKSDVKTGDSWRSTH